jgi:serine/threonine protein kinase
MAFEILLSGDARPAKIDYRLVDMWAFGVTLFVMCTGMFPWHKATVSDREFVAYMLGYVHKALRRASHRSQDSAFAFCRQVAALLTR